MLLLAGLGALLSLLAYVHLRQGAADDARAAAERHATMAATALTEAFGQHGLLADALAGLFAGARPVSRDDFQAFSARLFPGTAGLQAVAWLPRLEGGLHGPESFPVHFIEPMRANEAALGTDAAALAERRAALQRARDSAAAALSGRMVVPPRSGAEDSLVLFQAVYESGRAPDGLVDRRRALKGFVAVSFAVSRFAAVVEAGLPADQDLYLLDLDAPEGRRRLYFKPAPLAGEARSPLDEAELLAGPHLARTLELGGRTWRLLMVQPPLPSMPQPELGALAVLVVGLVLTGLLALLGLSSVARSRRSEQLALAIGHSNETLSREIAERREIESALRLTESRLQLALKSAPLSLFSQDADLRYTWIFKSRLGLTLEGVIGRTDAQVMAPEDAAILEPIKQQVLQTGVGCRQELRLPGARVNLDLAIEPLIDHKGNVNGIIGTAIDVTHERETQRRLAEARAEAERANEAKSRFLAAASHDLRQPLQATRLFLEVLKLRLDEPSLKGIVEKAMTALEATDGLLNALLDVSTLEAGVIRPEVGVFPVDRLLRRLADEGAPQAAAQGLRLRVVPCTALVRSDPVLLERMVRNLLANALRYTASGGILIGCRRAGAGTMRIDVCDTGPGIPADKLQMIFEDFYQIGNAERDRSRGLGLGLSVVERMARLLGHKVEVRSTVGSGSRFSIVVPLAGMLPAARSESLPELASA